jgi:hypothetical protein
MAARMNRPAFVVFFHWNNDSRTVWVVLGQSPANQDVAEVALFDADKPIASGQSDEHGWRWDATPRTSSHL